MIAGALATLGGPCVPAGIGAAAAASVAPDPLLVRYALRTSVALAGSIFLRNMIFCDAMMSREIFSLPPK